MTAIDLRRALRLSHVPRWGVVPTITKQSVAEHSFSTAIIALWLWGNLVNSAEIDPGDLLEYALRHDEWESVTGDIPSTAKRSGLVKVKTTDPDRHLNPDVLMLVKVADCLEAYIYLCQEIDMGNNSVRTILSDLLQKSEEFYTKSDIKELLGYLTFMDLASHLQSLTTINRHPSLEA